MSRGAEEENHSEGAPVATAVIAAFSSGSAKYRRVEMAAVRNREAARGWGRGAGRRPGQAAALVRQRVPDDEVQSHRVAPAWGRGGEEGAAVAAVEGEPAREVAGGGAVEGGVDRLEAGHVGYGVAYDAEEAGDVGRRVELPVAAAEVGVGEHAAPALAYDGGAEEARGVVGWDAEEDLADELVRQLNHRLSPACALLGEMARVLGLSGFGGLDLLKTVVLHWLPLHPCTSQFSAKWGLSQTFLCLFSFSFFF